MSDPEEIIRLITLYAHLLDDRRFDELSSLLSSGISLVIGEKKVAGRDEVVDSVKSAQSTGPVLHFTGTPVVEIEGDEARAWTDMIVVKPHEGGLAVTAFFRYTDDLVRLDGRWLFSRRHMRTHGTSVPGTVSAGPPL